MRANASDAPPGVCGTMIRTGLMGKLVVWVCADTEPTKLRALIKLTIKTAVSCGMSNLKIGIFAFFDEKKIYLKMLILKLFFYMQLVCCRPIFQFSLDFLIHYGIDRYEQSFLYFVEQMQARIQSIKMSFRKLTQMVVSSPFR